MEYLPAEIQLNILNNLNFDDLFSVKQTSRHFYYFINKYKDVLPHIRFRTFHIIQDTTSDIAGELGIRPDWSNLNFVREMANDFTLSIHLQKKWLSALDKQIPVFIENARPTEYDPLLLFYKVEKAKKQTCFARELPLIPQNTGELKFVRYMLLKIFSCVFDHICFHDFLLNPQMVELLFDNEEIAKLKFNCRQVILYFNNQNFNDWKFTFDLLIIKKALIIRLEKITITEEDSNILLELLSNEGDRIPQVIFNEFSNDNQIVLYNNLLNHLEKSTDLSKMVTKIKFDCMDWFCSNLSNWPRSKVIVRGVEMSESNNRKKHYKITNINDPKMIFSILLTIDEKDLIEYIDIVKIK